MIDTAISTHTPVTALMEMPLKRLLAVRMALARYVRKMQERREQEEQGG